jgi:predicted DCC family thiol-disulfide oxidoreductase YuxK
LTPPTRYPLTVFYDASCPLCATEMQALRDLDAAERLQLVDCSAARFSDEGLRAEGITRERLMGRIHARDAHGRWLVGIAAFEAIYRAAGLEHTARLWGSPRWRPVFERIYPWVARYRQLLSRLGAHHLVRHLIRGAANRRDAGVQPR